MDVHVAVLVISSQYRKSLDNKTIVRRCSVIYLNIIFGLIAATELFKLSYSVYQKALNFNDLNFEQQLYMPKIIKEKYLNRFLKLKGYLKLLF